MICPVSGENERNEPIVRAPLLIEFIQQGGKTMGDKKHDVTRRQFLNYTLMGVGGFMAAGMVLPMTRFAIDPLLTDQGEGKFVNVMAVNEITEEPQLKKFKVKTVDGWHRFEQVKQAYILNYEGEILAMSPVCTHLGCTVGWANNSAYPNQFYCPCHGGRYHKNGVNIEGTPPTAPLHVYETQVKDGDLYLGTAQPRGGA